MNKETQEQLTRLRYLDPPADGKWGAQSSAALKLFQHDAELPETGTPNAEVLTLLKQTPERQIKLGSDFASRVIQYMLGQGYWVPVGERAYTIAYVEGVNADGSINNDAPNEWNDRRLVIEIAEDVPKIIGNWTATSEPGDYWENHPMNDSGCARICFGQWAAWSMGYHNGRYKALVQSGSIKVTRDKNRDFARTNDAVEEGEFGINQHHGYDCPYVDNNSAGCLVGCSVAGHQDFVEVLEGDRRYQTNSGYQFYTAVIDGSKL